jgi:hypothetical protein
MNISQADIESFITKHNIDINDGKDCDKILEYFIDEYIMEQDKTYFSTSFMNYSFNSQLGLHSIYAKYRTTFIRDDARLSSKYFQAVLETKIGKPFPYILTSLNYCINKPDSAKEAAKAIKEFFPDDEDLMNFREWLLKTSMYAVVYELSC